MKLALRIVASILIVVGILFANLPSIKHVSAEVSNGTWVLPNSKDSFTLVNVDDEDDSAPTWLQRFSQGVEIQYPAQICHSFRGGNFKWVPEIREYKNGRWVKIPTTTNYIYGNEMPLYACADTPRGGTYALFAYYIGPAVTYTKPVPGVPGFDCSSITWDVTVTSTFNGTNSSTWFFSGNVTGVPSGTTIDWGVTEANPSFYVASNGYAGSTSLDGSNYMSVTRIIANDNPFSVLTVQFTESTHNCSYTGYLLPD